MIEIDIDDAQLRRSFHELITRHTSQARKRRNGITHLESSRRPRWLNFQPARNGLPGSSGSTSSS